MARILVVDDSALMRKKLREMLEPQGYEVIIARDGADAIEKARKEMPDVITLDINMPKLDGLSALAALLVENRNHKVIMFSSLTHQGAEATMEALAMGAFGFIPKPGGTISMNLDEVEVALLDLIESALGKKPKRVRQESNRASQKAGVDGDGLKTKHRPSVTSLRNGNTKQPIAELKPLTRQFNVTLIGVSTGGPRCVETILRELPANYPNPILISQHMPSGFTQAFAERLNSVCSLKVKEVVSGEQLLPGNVYIAKGGADAILVNRAGTLIVQSRPSREEYLWHPSVSLMVESALNTVPARRLVGVMLTGMGYDGADEMTQLKRMGGYTIAESEESCVVFGMPKELIERDGASEVIENQQIAQRLISLSQTNRRQYGIA